MPRVPLVVRDRSWMRRAACLGMAPRDGTVEPHPWFPERGQDELGRYAQLICSTCTVQKQCAQYALWFESRHLANGMNAAPPGERKPNRPNGIFGGMSGKARWRVLRDRRLRRQSR